jgi:GxxExxY protein
MKTCKHNELTEQIIRIFYDVYNELGYGFLENVYQNAFFIELQSKGFHVEPQKAIDVFYHNQVVGKYKADLIVNNLIILELKAVEALVPEHELQLINYLKATDKEVGLLLNFGMKPEIRRKAYDNDKKNLRKSNQSAPSAC